MRKALKYILCACFLAFVAATALNLYSHRDLTLTLAITFGTATYHLAMRFAVGYIFDKLMNNRADYSKRWYQLHPTEIRLYKIIKVKKWKSKMPSYQPDLFSPQRHTWDEIAQAMCQAELVHETIAILSFLPILAAIWWGAFGVFLVTSICAAVLDLSFAIMQRYNRPRVIKMLNKGNACRRDAESP